MVFAGWIFCSVAFLTFVFDAGVDSSRATPLGRRALPSAGGQIAFFFKYIVNKTRRYKQIMREQQAVCFRNF
jgi:hypothetical protein